MYKIAAKDRYTNNMIKYKYTGLSEVHIYQVGTVKPGETIEVEAEIDNPAFELVKDNKKTIKGQ